jgi:rhodanese-related sulfurtransferase
MRWCLLMVLAGALVMSAGACGSSDQVPTGADGAAFATVDVQTAHERLSTDAGAQVVDVREPSEWAETGVIPESVLIPLGQIEQRAPAELAKDRPVYVICRTGNRSRTAAADLAGLGFIEIYNIGGGIKAWLEAGLPVEAFRP